MNVALRIRPLVGTEEPAVQVLSDGTFAAGGKAHAFASSVVAGRDQALAHAEDLGLDACRDCKGCKCGVGIDLMGKVVRPLLEAAGE